LFYANFAEGGKQKLLYYFSHIFGNINDNFCSYKYHN
jgi:hypothetical protein